MKNIQIAKIFYNLADILEILNIQWKPAAYRKAARTLESLTEDIEQIYKEKNIQGLLELPSIGAGLAKKIIEYIKTNKISEFEKYKKQIPKGLLDIISIQSLGPKKAWLIYKKLKIKTVKELEEAAKTGKISKLSKFGKKSEEDILLGIKLLKKGEKRVSIGIALSIAESIKFKLKQLKFISKVDLAGSIRRRKETVGDIDILVISKKPKEVIDYFTNLEEIQKILAKGNTKVSVVLKQGINTDLRILQEKSYGSALNYLTGSKDHNVKLRQLALKHRYTLSEYGLFTLKNHKYIVGKTEEEIYKKLGMQYIEPELRENLGEVELSLKRKLRKIISNTKKH